MNFNFAIIFILFSITIKNFSQAELTEVVQTKYGPVQGDILTTVVEGREYSSFKGIPFARPPVGEYRFQPPSNPDPWTETLYAQQDANPCPQLDDSKKNLIGAEDCLYLNVYSPECELSAPKELRPVMVWFYGGAFVQGSVNNSYFGPDFIVEKDVVLVAMNYRLGALGFLTLGNEKISGNAGLKDQALALKWVNENIEKFGGDPNKITIFGESAGSVSVELHHLSPGSRGLFRASIAMSGSPLNPWAFNDLEKATKLSVERIQSKIINNFDVNSAEDVSKLCDVPFEKFVYLDDIVPTKTGFGFAFAPTNEVEGTQNQPFLTKKPLSMYQSGDFYSVPHILGYMSEEILAFKDLLVKKKIQDNKAAIDELTLNSFRVGINQTRQFMLDRGSKSVFYYRTVFDYPESLHKVAGLPIDGAAHGDDIAYVFYVQGTNQPLDPNNEVSIFRNKYVTLFTNFAKNLGPSAVFDDGSDIIWPPTDSAGLLLKMDKNFEILECDD